MSTAEDINNRLGSHFGGFYHRSWHDLRLFICVWKNDLWRILIINLILYFQYLHRDITSRWWRDYFGFGKVGSLKVHTWVIRLGFSSMTNDGWSLLLGREMELEVLGIIVRCLVLRLISSIFICIWGFIIMLLMGSLAFSFSSMLKSARWSVEFDFSWRGKVAWGHTKRISQQR